MKLWMKATAAALLLVAGYYIYAQGFSKDITVTVVAPTQNEDNSPLTNLTSIVVYYSPDGVTYSALVTLPATTPGATLTYVDHGRGKGTHSYKATAVNADNIESAFSNIAVKTFKAAKPPTVQVN